MINLRDVSKSFSSPSVEVHVLENVNLHCTSGEFVCILGESGSGKTTLLNIAAGLEDCDSGTVEICGNEITHATTAERCALRLRNIGMVFQDHNLIHEFTPLENVLLPLVARGIPKPEAVELAVDALESVGIKELMHRHTSQMSGGQLQRVGVARALAGNRKVLLCDEPTGSLDENNSQALFGLLRSLVETKGLCLLLCTHDLHALEHATRTLRVTGKQLHPVPEGVEL